MGRNERVGQGHGCVRTEFADTFDLLVYPKTPVDVGYCTPLDMLEPRPEMSEKTGLTGKAVLTRGLHLGNPKC